MFKVAYWLALFLFWISTALMMVGKQSTWIAMVISAIVSVGCWIGCGREVKHWKQSKSELGIMVVGLGVGFLIAAVFRSA